MKIETFRALIRPLVMLLFALLMIAMFWTGRVVPDLLKWTWLAIVGEFFGERLLFKLIKGGTG